MIFEELKIQLDLNDSINVLRSIGRQTKDRDWFVICDDGNCHLFDNDGNEINIKKIKILYEDLISRNIEKIIIPDSIESIEYETFYGCKNLTSVNIPDSVESIGDAAFGYCINLKSITIPYSVEHIGKGIFCGCENLKSITIPDSIKKIRDHAFTYCEKLTSITIPDSVEHIGYNAFIGCRNLKSIIFKGKIIDQVKSMEYYPFGIENKSIIKCIK